jgi:hypothetical protein
MAAAAAQHAAIGATTCTSSASRTIGRYLRRRRRMRPFQSLLIIRECRSRDHAPSCHSGMIPSHQAAQWDVGARCGQRDKRAAVRVRRTDLVPLRSAPDLRPACIETAGPASTHARSQAQSHNALRIECCTTSAIVMSNRRDVKPPRPQPRYASAVDSDSRPSVAHRAAGRSRCGCPDFDGG